jgi:hypothetical protein
MLRSEGKPELRCHPRRLFGMKDVDGRHEAGHDEIRIPKLGVATAAAIFLYADLASAPSIMSTVFLSPYTATNEPKRGPFSWPSSTW